MVLKRSDITFFILMAAVFVIISSSDVLVVIAAANTTHHHQVDSHAESLSGNNEDTTVVPVAADGGGDTSLGYCCDGIIEGMTCLPYNTGWHPHYPFNCKGEVVWWERRKFCIGRCSSY